MTLLQAVNKVLVKMRENQVTSVTDTNYSNLIATFVNDARREVEDAWNWMALRQTVSVTVNEDLSQYVLTGVGNARFKILSVINDTTDQVLTLKNSNDLTMMFLNNTQETQEPRFFGFNGFDANDDPIVDVYPIPDATYTLRFNLVVPQNELTLDSSDILVPSHIVVLGAVVKAMAERGEEGNSGYEVANAVYTGALSSAIAQESALFPGETDFYAV